jgi:polyisoprenoid-binding protein YceI
MAHWTIDPLHSDVNFKVRHLMISTVKGSFSSYEAAIEGDEVNGFADASFHFSADVASISTGSEQRDGHLKSAEFFNAEQFPKLTFASTGFEKGKEGQFKLLGHLTIKDKTSPVELAVDFNGIMVDSYGQTKAGFSITGSINRQEYGLTWSAVTEAGGVVLADEVKLELEVQMIKQP